MYSGEYAVAAGTEHMHSGCPMHPKVGVQILGVWGRANDRCRKLVTSQEDGVSGDVD